MSRTFLVPAPVISAMGWSVVFCYKNGTAAQRVPIAPSAPAESREFELATKNFVLYSEPLETIGLRYLI
jgi:hypothetical protein